MCLLFLNSKLITWYYRTITAEEGKVFAQIKIQLLKLLPIHTLEKERQMAFVEIVDKVLAAKAADPQADTRGLEAQIDKMVYLLYGLTEEEVQVVEGKG
ncbi:MAG: hypothetical protein Ta2B_10280 [Termitinemataceae bacterium]|nr:MAG: hypothetical protein Ta2B_10280 [Termitinemataceae bacterium]